MLHSPIYLRLSSQNSVKMCFFFSEVDVQFIGSYQSPSSLSEQFLFAVMLMPCQSGWILSDFTNDDTTECGILAPVHSFWTSVHPESILIYLDGVYAGNLEHKKRQKFSANSPPPPFLCCPILFFVKQCEFPPYPESHFHFLIFRVFFHIFFDCFLVCLFFFFQVVESL